MGPLDFLKPVGDAIGEVVKVLRIPFEFILHNLYNVFHGIGVINAVGAYGLAVIVMTVVIKLCLFPLYQKQLKMSRKTQEEQRRVAPELAVIRKKYKGDPQKLNTEMMALYKEHGINPLGGLAGCLPTLAQLPILIGLYQAIYNFHDHIDPHFLWIHDLVQSASVSHPITWILPALAGATTFVQSKMMAPPPAAAGDDSQAAQMAQMTSTMSLLMPGMIIFFAFQPRVQQALVLYWIVSNLFSITQQYFINGWGQLPILGAKSAAPATTGGRGRAEASGSGNGNGKSRGNGISGGADIKATNGTRSAGGNANGTSNGNGNGNGNGKAGSRRPTGGGRRKRR
jgi:YidC/Oxa1 family membrane protein insertase